MNARSQDIERFAAWMTEHGAFMHDAVSVSTEVVAGIGCLATRSIKRGSVLFRIPRASCLGASADAAVDDEAPGDTQQQVAQEVLREADAGAASPWRPLLRLISPAPCPFIWPAAAKRFLDGTELEEVVRRKRKRLRSERAALGLEAHAQAYDACCALVASHINPWFGGSITPFNCTLNYSPEPNVEFAAEGDDAVVARARRRIGAGEEMTQEYCQSTASLLYRYGFVPAEATTSTADDDDEGGGGGSPRTRPMADDVVSFRAAEVAARCDLAADGQGEWPARLPLLCAAGAVGESTWDGLEDVMTVELGARGEGTAKLVGVILAFGVSARCWSRAAEAAREAAATEEGEEEVDDDAQAAAVVRSLFGLGRAHAKAMAALAAAEGGEEGDPWPALLSEAASIAAASSSAFSSSEAMSTIDAALQSAVGVVCTRREQLEACAAAAAAVVEEVEAASARGAKPASKKRPHASSTATAPPSSTAIAPPSSTATAPPSGRENGTVSVREASELAHGLRAVEMAILDDAASVLKHAVSSAFHSDAQSALAVLR